MRAQDLAAEENSTVIKQIRIFRSPACTFQRRADVTGTKVSSAICVVPV